MNTEAASAAAAAAPEPDAQLAALSALGWREEFAAALPAPLPPTARVARVVAQHRNSYDVHDGSGIHPAAIARALHKPGVAAEQRPAVGDWVWMSVQDDGGWLIEAHLPRHSLLRRAAAGVAHRAQIIASNIDTALIVCGLDGDFNPRRIERYLAIVVDSGAAAVVVLTKADQRSDAPAVRELLAGQLGGAIPVVTVNAKATAALGALAPWLGRGQTLVLVGSSGAGKSTLTNTLIGHEAMKTGAVRATDSRGRHTTSHRALLTLPGGACLIDTPGMREIKLLGDEDLAAANFSDVELLAGQCRFSDCQHHSEPGCAVQSALADGRLSQTHWDSFRKLQAEQEAVRRRGHAHQRKAAERSAEPPFRERAQETHGKPR